MLPPKPWKPDRVVWLLLAFIASMILGFMVVQGYASALSKEDATQPMNIVVMLAGTAMYQGVTLVLISIFLRTHHLTWTEAFGFNAPRLGRTLGLAVLAAALVLPLTMALGYASKLVIEALGGHAQLQEPVRTLQASESFEQQVHFAIVTIFVAPFIEEVLFRGILYPTVKQFGFPRFALWSTSLFFAYSHFNATAFVPLAFMGVILTFLYETTENLLAPIVTHALFNATNFALLLRQMSNPGS